jgi:hypothetical protein
MTPRIFDNAGWKGGRPLISVLVSYHRDDPRPLLAALGAESVGSVEVILLDDGTADDVLHGAVCNALERLPHPARLVALDQTEGAARGRNRLAAEARGRWFLFLDADTAPDSAGFLHRWINLVGAEAPVVAFGGLSLKQTLRSKDVALHRALLTRDKCASLAARRAAPHQHLFGANLLVRRDVMEQDRFDERFTGRGWEDVEWAMRTCARHPPIHIDNSASLMGLYSATALARQQRESAEDFGRLVAAHGGLIGGLPSYRAAMIFQKASMLWLWRPLLWMAAVGAPAPSGLRAGFMRLYQGAVYAQAVRSPASMAFPAVAGLQRAGA